MNYTRTFTFLATLVLMSNTYASFSLAPVNSQDEPIILTIRDKTPNGMNMYVTNGTHSMYVATASGSENPCANLKVTEFDTASDTTPGTIDAGIIAISSSALVQRIGPGATCFLSMDVINEIPYVTGPILLEYDQVKGIYQSANPSTCTLDYTQEYPATCN